MARSKKDQSQQPSQKKQKNRKEIKSAKARDVRRGGGREGKTESPLGTATYLQRRKQLIGPRNRGKHLQVSQERINKDDMKQKRTSENGGEKTLCILKKKKTGHERRRDITPSFSSKISTSPKKKVQKLDLSWDFHRITKNAGKRESRGGASWREKKLDWGDRLQRGKKA